MSDDHQPSSVITTLAPEEIDRFLQRTRRQREDERIDVQLDVQLRDVLARANDFAPSEAGSILLDDPRIKSGTGAGRLTFIACFGDRSSQVLGTRIPADRGIAGRIYTQGQPYLCTDVATDPFFAGEVDQMSGFKTRSVLGTPVVIGESICGVLELLNRCGEQPYVRRDLELLQTFARYISSSIQNALDAVRARALARTDALTGLANDRFLHVRLGEELEHAEESNSDLAVLFLDLDHFKSVNDRHGHLAGSRTLREVGGVLASQLPPGAFAARYGGDEFVVILRATDCTQAREVGEAICKRIAASVFIVAAGADVPALNLTGITASIGVASYQEHMGIGGTREQRQNRLLHLADAAMYRAKAEGKNRVVVAEPE